MRQWFKKYKFWLIWTPLTLLWVFISFCIASIYGNSTRGLAFLLASPLVIVGLYFASKRTTTLESQNKIDSNRLLTETFAKSLELLGHDQAAVRQGAIYALGKIAKTNLEELEVIVNTLCAFIRHNQNKEQKNNTALAIDIEAAIKTITKLSSDFDNKNSTRYDLSNIYLLDADFSHAKLINFNLSDSHFYTCIFEKVDFSNSNLVSSNFEKSNFKGATFNKKTEIMGANFSSATNLTKEMLESAQKNDDTKFPNPPRKQKLKK